MKKYKLVRVINGKYFSANTICAPIEYRIGEIAAVDGRGIACYKRLADVDRWKHLKETSDYFNNRGLVAILWVVPIGRTVFRAENYRPGGSYEGGINYRSVKVEAVVKTISWRQIVEMGRARTK